jgi:uncharacterized membrane protein (DUF4010 family)
LRRPAPRALIHDRHGDSIGVDTYQIDLLRGLGIALAIGLLIGAERGWSDRDLPEGGRVAGLRTFGLIGLAGGLAVLVARSVGDWFAVAGLVAVAAVLIAGYWWTIKAYGDLSATSVIAGILTFCLGALAMQELWIVAAAAGVVTALLLGLKPTLHRLLRRIEERELLAVLQLLLISLVILPVLPDEGYGPYGALNPRQLWWMVVLIAGLSFAGYVAVKVAGTQGIILTGIFGGLASSTAVTLTFARLGRAHPPLQRALATGIALAWTVMYVRMGILIAVVAPALLRGLIYPLALMTVVGLAAGLSLLRRADRAAVPEQALTNPFEIGMALRFAALIAVVMLLSHALRDWFGDAGMLALAFVSGLADVDAITLTVGEQAGAGLAATTASLALLIAAGANTAMKCAMAMALAGGAMARWVALTAVATIAAGLAGVWLSGALAG